MCNILARLNVNLLMYFLQSYVSLDKTVSRVILLLSCVQFSFVKYLFSLLAN